MVYSTKALQSPYKPLGRISFTILTLGIKHKESVS